MPTLSDLPKRNALTAETAGSAILPAVDPTTNKHYKIPVSELLSVAELAAAPVNTVVAAKATATWTVGSTEVALEAITAGTAGDILTFNIKDPSTLDPAQGAGRPIAEAFPNANEIDVVPATDDGDNATAEITTSGTAMTVKHYLTGYGGNDDTITFALRTVAITDFPTGNIVLPSKALAATWDAGTGVVAVKLGTAAGVTAAKLTLTESVGASAGALKIEQRAGYIGTWANNKVRCKVVMAGVSTALSAGVEIPAGTGFFEITINLATTSEGLPNAAANTEALVVAAVQAALDATPIISFDAAADWGDLLLCSRINAGAEIFSSPNDWVVMGDGTGSNTAGVNALADNTANAVAFLKTAIEALPAAGTKFDVTADGTGHVSGGTTETFAGGGDNYSPTSTVLEIIAAVEALAIEDERFTFTISAGDGSDVVPIGGDVATFTGGVDYVPPTYSGYPFVHDNTTLFLNIGTDALPVWRIVATLSTPTP